MRRPTFNLIITHLPGYDNYVTVLDQLKRVLGDELVIVDTRQSIVLARVNDPYEAAERLVHGLPKATPVLRIIPVDEVTDAYVHRIAEVVRKLVSKRVPEGASFKIVLDGHPYDVVEGGAAIMHRSEAVKIIAEGIDRRVDLSNPDWVVYVKVLRLYGTTELAAVTVCPPDKIISLVKLRRG